MSIRRQLLMLSLAVFTLATFFAALHGYRNSQQQVDALFDNDLVNMASFIASSQTMQAHDSEINASHSKVEVISVNLVFQVLHQGRVIKRSHIAPLDPINASEAGFMEQTFFAKRWRTYTQKLDDSYSVVVAQPLDFRRDSAESIVLTTVAPIIYAMPIIAILLFYVIRKSLASLIYLSRELKNKSSDDLAEIKIAHAPKELVPVVARVNSLFSRLSSAFDRERTLSANAAHELRTPVSVLRLTAHNLKAARANNAISNAQLNELDANVNRMAHVIEQIIALYRYSPEHFSEHLEVLSLDHLLREVIADNYNAIADNEQEVSFDAESAQIMGDTFALQVLFENVLKNAIKYSGQGSQINIRMQRNEDGEQSPSVTVLIEDSGHVDSHEIARLTDTFYRAKNMSQTGVKGSGLGLSIVQYIAQIHGATLNLGLSQLGGLAVTLSFDLVETQLPEKGV